MHDPGPAPRGELPDDVPRSGGGGPHQRPDDPAALADVLPALQAESGRFPSTIEFEGASGFEALDRAQAEAAHAEILKQYGIAERQEPLAALASGREPWRLGHAWLAVAWALLLRAPRRRRGSVRDPGRWSPCASRARNGTGRRPGRSRRPGRGRLRAWWCRGPAILVATPSIGNHLLIEVQKQGEDLRTPARLVLSDPEGPFALLAVDDPAFWKGLAPLPIAETVRAGRRGHGASLAALGAVRVLARHAAAGARRAPRPVAHQPPDPGGLVQPRTGPATPRCW